MGASVEMISLEVISQGLSTVILSKLTVYVFCIEIVNRWSMFTVPSSKTMFFNWYTLLAMFLRDLIPVGTKKFSIVLFEEEKIGLPYISVILYSISL